MTSNNLKIMTETKPMTDIHAINWRNEITINALDDIGPVALKLKKFADYLGDFRVGASDNIVSSRPLSDSDGNILATNAFGWTDEEDSWWKSTFRALRAPYLQACRYEGNAFWMNEAGFHCARHNAFLDDIDTSTLSDYAKCQSIICVPVHMPFAQLGVVVFFPKNPDITDLSQIFERHANEIEDVSKRFITHYTSIMSQRHWIPKNCELTRREIECLRLSALGKTDAEMATVLSVRKATIRYHLTNAARKLDAVNKIQSVFKAGQLGFLGTADLK